MTSLESRPTYKEVDGEILPSYTGVNAPVYPSIAARDTEPPHDHLGSGPLEATPDSTVKPSANGLSVPLDRRDFHLIQAMNKWAEANKLSGFAAGMQTNVHRARLGADDDKAANAAEKSRKLRDEARSFFEAATGIHEMDDTAELSPEVLIISFFQDFKDKVLKDKRMLDKRRKLHRNNMQKRAAK